MYNFANLCNAWLSFQLQNFRIVQMFIFQIIFCHGMRFRNTFDNEK